MFAACFIQTVLHSPHKFPSNWLLHHMKRQPWKIIAQHEPEPIITETTLKYPGCVEAVIHQWEYNRKYGRDTKHHLMRF